VSMRVYVKPLLPLVQEIADRFPYSHGEPISCVGVSAPIFAFLSSGVHKVRVVSAGFQRFHRYGNLLGSSIFGDALDVLTGSGEILVFWGCGVTAQVVVMESLAAGVKEIGHAPGHMVFCNAPAAFDSISENATPTVSLD